MDEKALIERPLRAMARRFPSSWPAGGAMYAVALRSAGIAKTRRIAYRRPCCASTAPFPASRASLPSHLGLPHHHEYLPGRVAPRQAPQGDVLGRARRRRLGARGRHGHARASRHALRAAPRLERAIQELPRTCALPWSCATYRAVLTTRSPTYSAPTSAPSNPALAGRGHGFVKFFLRKWNFLTGTTSKWMKTRKGECAHELQGIPGTLGRLH